MDFLIMSQNKIILNYPAHTHEMWEILLNIEGNGTALIDGIPYEFQPGTIFCIRPGIPHSKSAEKGFLDGCVLIRDFCFKSEKENVLVFHDDERRTFYSLFKAGLEFPFNPATDIYGERFLRCIVDAMQNLLSHWKQESLSNPEVLKVQKILSEHVKDASFDISSVLESTPYSPNHLRKIFRDQCGCSPLTYYHRLKVQLAKQLLLQNKSIMTVSEIARMCGFEDPYYFSRVFKKVEGISPLHFYLESSEATPPEAKQDFDIISSK